MSQKPQMAGQIGTGASASDGNDFVAGSRRDKVAGGLIGLLLGDAIGVPYEFQQPTELPPAHQIGITLPAGHRSSYPGVPSGTWSDDGAQALCLLSSLLDCGKLDGKDLARRLVQWMVHGTYAVDRIVFDIGRQTRKALLLLASEPDQPFEAGPNGLRDNGNGSLMRVLPLALWHAGTDTE